MSTRDTIIQKTKHLFATNGYEGLSMRSLASTSGTTLSNIYHYFPSKEKLLEEIFNTTNTNLGEKRKLLPEIETASEMLKQRIEFQFANAEDIVFVLKYYLEFRKKFKKNDEGFLPPKTYLHIEEVLRRGKDSGEFDVKDIYEDAQVIAHSINGFVLEYYPHKLSSKERDHVVKKIHGLLIRAILNHDK
jgi:AcrR family transcriptional regulator